jgi:hypothetical protein
MYIVPNMTKAESESSCKVIDFQSINICSCLSIRKLKHLVMTELPNRGDMTEEFCTVLSCWCVKVRND